MESGPAAEVTSPARGSSLGQCLDSVLQDLQSEGRLQAEARDLVFNAFEEAFAEELAQLPRFWELKLQGKIQTYNLAGHERMFSITKASIHAQAAAFHDLHCLRITGRVSPSATAKRRRTIRRP
eukprot:TRINITY_DN50504_c0_g1_i1.p1 TRINITY_DN50504_c0_g1~~TRINITY_DN50504_c0_g1_i1.p1  ORF type:complete len:133 (+),score=28.77 TRINITY_DN50504_c0_g1_i1:28-399(+)